MFGDDNRFYEDMTPNAFNFGIEPVDMDGSFKTIRANLDAYIKRCKSKDPEYDPLKDINIAVMLHSFEIVSERPDAEWN